MAEGGTLAYFNKMAPIKIVANASPVGLGAVLLQKQKGEWTPIYYASCSLTECEQRHSTLKLKRKHYSLCGHVKDSMPMSMESSLTLQLTTNNWKRPMPHTPSLVPR